ncbi:MAG: hypothetical protein AAGK78_00065 [Planctomycetota bacterium]
MVLTLRCEKADELRLRKRHGETEPLENLAEVLHRGICGTCRRSKRQADAMEKVLTEFRDREPNLDPAAGYRPPADF